MKHLEVIKEVKLTPIALSDPPLLNAAGLHAPYALRIVTEIKCKNGVIGISEIPGSARMLDHLERFKRHLIGRSPFDLTLIEKEVRRFVTASTPAEVRGVQSWDDRLLGHLLAAVEIACFDLQGKLLDLSIAELLGGAVRDELPFCGYLFFKEEGAGGEFGFSTSEEATGWSAALQKPALDPDGVLKQAEAMIEAFGFRSLKLKAGVFEPEIEVRTIELLFEHFGSGVPLRIDPNAIWKYDTALHWGRKLQGLIEYYEDPVRGQESMAKLRRELPIPLATNMCTTSFQDLPNSVALGSEDIILGDLHFWGGFRPSVQLAKFCQTFGRKLSMHSNSHAGVSLAAMLQFGAAQDNTTLDFDTHYPWQENDIIKGGKLPIRGGMVTLPDGPGLGVELDEDAMAQAHQNYLNCGLTERNDEIEMARKYPGWKFRKTRY